METLGLTLGGGVVTVVGVLPVQRCSFLCGILPVGLGDGVRDCHHAAIP